MAAPSTSGNKFRNLSRKISGPTFRTGIGAVYRELEKEGKIPAEGIEKKAEYEANKKAKAEQLANKRGFFGHIKAMASWVSSVFD